MVTWPWAGHPWFKGFDWNGLEFKKLKPPFKPKIKSKTDTQNFFTYSNTDEPVPFDRE